MNAPLSPRPLALALLTLATTFVSPPVVAARIAEPDTVIYGRVFQRLGQREFVLTQGRLAWTLRSTLPTPRELTLATRLRLQADGRSSYQLRLPHQLLANDLTVGDSHLAVTGASQPLSTLEIHLDGQPLAALPAAVSDFAVSQKDRARAWHIDLELAGAPTDSDGDGLPDWWEDDHGFDKWTPDDPDLALRATSTPPSTPNPTAAAARTFAEWRAAFFPQDQRPLDVSGEDDPDGDGLPNLLEYAFDLDPTSPPPAGVTVTPRLIGRGGQSGLAFRRRAAATDLEFHIDVAETLGEWRDASAELEATDAPSTEPGLAAQLLKSSAATPNHQFLRLRVVRH